MSVILIIFFSIVALIVSKLIFQRWLNLITVYIFSWGGMLFLYETKLLNYYELSFETWFVIIITSSLFFLGGITPVVISGNVEEEGKKNRQLFHLFEDDGVLINRIIFAFGAVTFFVALFNSWVLLNQYGSVARLFLSANDIYRQRVDSEIKGLIPYVGGFSIAGIILAGMYLAEKNKISFAILFLFTATLLKDLVQFARIGMLITFIVFVLSFLLYKSYRQKRQKAGRVKLILASLVIFLLIIGSASIVRLFRGSYESYRGASTELRSYKTNILISPSLYFYLSSHIGVFNSYLEKENEITVFAQNTLSPFLNFLAKFGLADRAPFHQKGYLIPMWSNSSTYLRELHSDFGYLGLFIIPYFIGLGSSLIWRNFISSGSFICFILTVFFFSLIALTFFSLIVRGPDFYVAIVLLYLCYKMILPRQEDSIPRAALRQPF